MEIHDQLADAFTKRGMPAENVQVYAGLAVEALIDLLGGQSIYVPFCTLDRVFERNEQIRRDFTGHNHAELSAKYRLSMARIYKIVKQMNGGA